MRRASSPGGGGWHLCRRARRKCGTTSSRRAQRGYNAKDRRVAGGGAPERAIARPEIASLIAAVEQRGHLIDTQYHEIAALNQPQARPAAPRARAAHLRHASGSSFGIRRWPRRPEAAQPAADNVKPFVDAGTTADWLEFGKAKLRSSNGSGGNGSFGQRVSPEQSAYGVIAPSL